MHAKPEAYEWSTDSINSLKSVSLFLKVPLKKLGSCETGTYLHPWKVKKKS